MEAPSKMTTLTPSAKSFTGGPNASNASQKLHNQNYDAYQAPNNNVTLSYPHKRLKIQVKF